MLYQFQTGVLVLKGINMGCWNHTDMLSQMHIYAGEKVVSFFLVQSSPRESLCYSTCYYRPIPIILYGSYNDYGAVDEFTGQFDDILIDYLKKNVVTLELGENKYHDIAVNPSLLTMDFLYEADLDTRLQVKTWRGNSLCRHVVIKESLFNKILEEFYISSYDKVNGDYKRRRVYFKDITAGLEEQAKKVIEIVAAQDLYFIAEHAFREYTRWGDDAKHIPIVDYLPVKNYGSDSSPHDIGFFQYLRAMPQDKAIEFIREYLKFEWLSYFISATRKIWIPQTGQGGQNADRLGYEILANHSLGEIARENAEYQDYDEEDEEDEESA